MFACLLSGQFMTKYLIGGSNQFLGSLLIYQLTQGLARMPSWLDIWMGRPKIKIKL